MNSSAQQVRVGVQVLIQARMGSTRLPGKILAPFAGGLTVLEWIIERARSSKYAERVIVATTTNQKDDETVAACDRQWCLYFRGNEDDVLNRFVGAIETFPCDIILHVTADNPFFDVDEMDRAAELLMKEKLDYVNTHPAGLPLGTGTEAFTSSAFLRMANETTDPYDHEHVTPYFYHHPEQFKQKDLAPRTSHSFAPRARLTLDTSEDLAFLKRLTELMSIEIPNRQPATNEILSFLDQHPEIVAINANIVQKTFPSSGGHRELP